MNSVLMEQQYDTSRKRRGNAPIYILKKEGEMHQSVHEAPPGSAKVTSIVSAQAKEGKEGNVITFADS